MELIKLVKVKSKEEAARKYKDSIGRVPGNYRASVAKTTGVIAAAIAAEPLYKAKMEEALAAGRRAKALAQVTDEDWRRGAMEKGAARIGPGMSAGAGKQAKNWAPYHDTLASLELPARSADPMANVTARVGGVVQALVNKKKEIKG